MLNRINIRLRKLLSDAEKKGNQAGLQEQPQVSKQPPEQQPGPQPLLRRGPKGHKPAMLHFWRQGAGESGGWAESVGFPVHENKQPFPLQGFYFIKKN